ncbi:MAG: endonuclease/exonuclease/phosphatase family protein [Cytophagaceae bacterium]|jgi:endonuclease/exonuclease/phosphatase family metal-dependent hydrolase|nr:endonuclease/exonuclease/phosphatase family protein [Cytophagaceae bacterium]
MTHGKSHTFPAYTAITALFMLLLPACSETKNEAPATPVIHISFNGKVNNTGLWNVTMHGGDNTCYAQGIDSACFNLTATARYRQPVVIEKPQYISAADYQGMSFMVWIKATLNDPYEYTVLGQKESSEEFGTKGWSLGKSSSGSWKWWFSDGVTELAYNPTYQRQPVNDGKWHLIGFTIDYSAEEARLYYDGLNVAVFCTDETSRSATVETPYIIGCDPLSTEPSAQAFNGTIDEVGVWTRTLSSEQVALLYAQYKKPRSSGISETIPDSLVFMSWNITLGGQKEGKYVGVERVVDVIRESNADVVAIQEVYGSGEMIADALGFFYYQRNPALAVASRFPLGKTYNILRKENAGVVTVELPKGRQLIFCPVRLNYLPDQRAYITSGIVNADTIVVNELKTRGAEMRYILWDLQALINNSAEAPLIVAGDFNSGSHLDWTDANRNTHYGLAVDYPASRLLSDAGFIDAYRALYPDETLHRGITFPLDTAEAFKDRTSIIYYIGNKLRLKSCAVISRHPNGFPSEHGAVVAAFGE